MHLSYYPAGHEVHRGCLLGCRSPLRSAAARQVYREARGCDGPSPRPSSAFHAAPNTDMTGRNIYSDGAGGCIRGTGRCPNTYPHRTRMLYLAACDYLAFGEWPDGGRMLDQDADLVDAVRVVESERNWISSRYQPPKGRA